MVAQLHWAGMEIEGLDGLHREAMVVLAEVLELAEGEGLAVVEK